MNNREDRSAHLTFEQLSDYQEGRLSEDGVDLVEAHLATECGECQDDLNWLQKTQSALRNDDWVQPPDALRAIARRSYREHYRPLARSSPWPGWLSAILAPRPQFVMVGAAALILLVTVGVVLVALVGQEPSLMASVTEVTGLVEMKRAGSDEWQAIQVGTELKASDRLRSADDASALLRFPDRSLTDIAGNTQLTILQLRTPRSDEGQIVVLRQTLGNTRYDVQPQESPESRFEIETPSAKVSVVGTIFMVDVTESGGTLVTVMEGFVEVSGEGNSTVVEAGDLASVLPGKPPAPGVPLPTQTPTPVVVEATEVPSAGDLPTEEAASPDAPSPEPTHTPSPTFVVLASPTPTSPPVQPTSPPAQSTQPPPQPTQPPAEPTSEPEPEETRRTPPGQTKTPQPPGQTKTPGAPGG
jgi:hypothetical protein